MPDDVRVAEWLHSLALWLAQQVRAIGRFARAFASFVADWFTCWRTATSASYEGYGLWRHAYPQALGAHARDVAGPGVPTTVSDPCFSATLQKALPYRLLRPCLIYTTSRLTRLPGQGYRRRRYIRSSHCDRREVSRARPSAHRRMALRTCDVPGEAGTSHEMLIAGAFK